MLTRYIFILHWAHWQTDLSTSTATLHFHQKCLHHKVGSGHPVSFDFSVSFSPHISWEIGGEGAGEDEEVERGHAGKHKVTELFRLLLILFWRLVRGSVGCWGRCVAMERKMYIFSLTPQERQFNSNKCFRSYDWSPFNEQSAKSIFFSSQKLLYNKFLT